MAGLSGYSVPAIHWGNQLWPEDLNAMVATGPMSAKTLSAWR